MSLPTQSKKPHANPLLPVAAAAVVVCALSAAALTTAQAQGVATEQQLQTVTITGAVTNTAQRATLDPNLPSTTASKTGQELREQQNIFNPEDALKNLPNTVIRKRYSGDRNALIGGRSFSTAQAPRGLVFMDGYLISNFLGGFDAPRWNMVAPEEMQRIDVLYGPFSAIYPGNSIGTTVAITTSRPKRFEGSVRVAGQSQTFGEYGRSDTYNNAQASALLGTRWDNGTWAKLMLNRQDSTSQPQQWLTINANNAGVFTPPSGTATVTPVTGVLYDTAPTGQKRAVLGANAGAVDHTVQTTAKLTAGYDFGDSLAVEGFVAAWRNDTLTRNDSFLRDNAGNPVWSGRVSNNGNVFQIAANAFAPFTRNERHLQGGVTVKTRYKTGWNASLVASQYRIQGDIQRTASNPDPVAANGGTGIAVARDGTGFKTFEVQGSYTPTPTATPGDWAGGQHAFTFGLHANEYSLKQATSSLPDWRSSAGTTTQFVGGDTRLLAAYVQDAWMFAPDWRLTSGLRLERWRSYNGTQRFTPGPVQDYADKTITATSPKLSLSWDGLQDTTLRVSFGKGTRFATVSELFQGTQSGNSIVVNDPNLRPEVSTALELFAERRFTSGAVRVSVFQDDVRDTIFRQTNLAVFPNITNTQNIDRVRTRGIELAADWQDLGVKGLSIDGNIAFNRPVIVRNDNNPGTVGKVWLRIPAVRGAATVTYKATPAWTVSGTYRASGRQYNELTNSDINPNVYGGLSSLRQLDLRVLWKPLTGTEVAFGIDNATDYRAYQSHPFPGRTLFGEVRYAF